VSGASIAMTASVGVTVISRLSSVSSVQGERAARVATSIT
jgi:hypothetical protein